MENKPFIRKRFFFPQPWSQLKLIIPILVVLFLATDISCFFLLLFRDWAAVSLLETRDRIHAMDQYMKMTNHYLVIFWILNISLAFLGCFWGWLLSFRIYGPFTRLERELKAIDNGVMHPEGLRVRKGDALFHIVEMVRSLLVKHIPPH